ncbi:tumor necrosis factor receptor superfamily member 11A isoform X2 [Microcaecilia unicolor]|uniref:Tumor necrosis factor receptor superfamily member 5 n=1 Tax=Microcaecilia unicolor TaxID=1415580 RepID=A0A6P7Y1W8_9AMPH|nr:tumor necrosis factor receptor superfamily member 11A isoform X2 [Microcaecilia unicolor]
MTLCHGTGRFIRGWIMVSIFFSRKQVSQQNSDSCENEKHYIHAGRCCMKCAPGHYLHRKCNATSNTTCLPCGPDQYMNTWNDEDKCLRQKLCDPGKGLVVVNRGNSTFQRECACKPGYHWIRAFEFCTRNTVCGPGFEAEIPSHNDRDTICKECQPGYFSSNSSATEKCKPWTNCSASGRIERVLGTTKMDAFCVYPDHEQSKVLQIVIPSILFLCVTLVVVIFVVYLRKKVKAVTDVQNWVNEACNSIRGNKEKSSRNAINKVCMNTFCQQHSEGMYPLILDEKSFLGDVCCFNGQSPCGKGCLDGRHCHFEENTLILSLEYEDDQLRHGPTENEYVYNSVQRVSDASGQPESKPTSPLTEPLEIEDLSQCFTGTDVTPDGEDSCESVFLNGTDCIHASTHNSTYCTCKGSVEDAQKVTNLTHSSLDQINGFQAHEMSRRESHRKWRKPLESTVPLSSEEHFPHCACSLHLPSSLENNASTDTSFDCNGTKQQNTEASGISNSCTSDAPSPSGNVTGNCNSTFISSGQVMNFKGDVIVVYVSQNSQEAPAASGTCDGNVGSPVQEENQYRCDSFVANTQQHNTKCGDTYQACSTEDKALNNTVKCERSPETVFQEETRDCQYPGPCHQNVASLPVQEEGKSEHLSKEAWKAEDIV